MEKKVTIYDIAKAANVSAATVSYVINNREDQSISEDTKNKIWHIINLLNYKPNVFAQNLRTSSDRKLVAVCIENNGTLERDEAIRFFDGLSGAFGKKYGLLFVTPPFDKIDNADAIIAYNVSKETFYMIGNKNFIPLVAVNCIIDDPLFFQISADYLTLRKKADEYFAGEKYRFVCLTPADITLKNEISASFDDVVFVDGIPDLFSVKAENALAVHTVIADVMRSLNANVLEVELFDKICAQTAGCVEKASSRERFDIHSYRV